MRNRLALMCVVCMLSLGARLGFEDPDQNGIHAAINANGIQRIDAVITGTVVTGDVRPIGYAREAGTIIEARCIPQGIAPTMTYRIRRCGIVAGLLSGCTSLTTDESPLASLLESQLTISGGGAVSAGDWIAVDFSSVTTFTDSLTCSVFVEP